MKYIYVTMLVLSGVVTMLSPVAPPVGGRSCHVDADCRYGETCQQKSGVWQCVETKGSEP